MWAGGITGTLGHSYRETKVTRMTMVTIVITVTKGQILTHPTSNFKPRTSNIPPPPACNNSKSFYSFVILPIFI